MRFLTTSTVLIFGAAMTAVGFAAQVAPQSSAKPQALQTSTQLPPQANKPKTGINPRVMIVDPRNNNSRGMLQPGTFDKGIYVSTYADGQSMCAAIMSYNFTPGENPMLKDVTTCTPARPNSVYRTRDGKTRQPPAPSLQMISMPQTNPSVKGTGGK